MDENARRQKKSSRRNQREALAKALRDYYRTLAADAPSDKFQAWIADLAQAPESRDSMH